jgi:hypothetical protein
MGMRGFSVLELHTQEHNANCAFDKQEKKRRTLLLEYAPAPIFSYQSKDKCLQVIFQTAYTSHTTHFAHFGQLTRLLLLSMCLNHCPTGYLGLVLLILLGETSSLSSNG